MKRMCMLLLCFLLLLTSASAASGEILTEQAERLGLDRLSEAAGVYGPGTDVAGADLDAGLRSLLEEGQAAAGGVLRKAVRSAVSLLAVVLLASLAQGVWETAGEGVGLPAVPMAAACAITAIAVKDADALIGMGREMLERMESFGQILLPTMAAATALGGAPGSAAARQFAAMLFSNLLLTAITSLLLPLTYGYIAASFAWAAVGNEGLKRMAGVLKWVVTTVLTVLLLTYVGYLTASGVVAGTADAMAVKAARFTVSSMVPVVGGILSDAAETVLAGAGVLKNAVGIFGMLTVLSISLVPFLQLAIHYLTYKLTGALAATVADGRVAGLIDQIGSAFGLVLGMTGASALLLLVSMVSAVSLSSP
ncbi:stage III sporulation protein AE [Intestinimonas sp.]|uniref:stage III sporulation protein AE n=1 Tax=Intestinimonas sp. TaxID=1965293 RepID=UPI00261F674D|nr:stage III sporulation protein AE [Intestinimonas sp.]